MYFFAQVLLLILIFVDVMQSQKRKADIMQQIPGESNFFERLSNVDRKWWLAEEVLYRQRFGLYTMTENTFEFLCKTQGKNYKLANDPPNYLLLMD